MLTSQAQRGARSSEGPSHTGKGFMEPLEARKKPSMEPSDRGMEPEGLDPKLRAAIDLGLDMLRSDNEDIRLLAREALRKMLNG